MMPGPEGIGVGRAGRAGPAALVETAELTAEFDCDDTCELPQQDASPQAGGAAVAAGPPLELDTVLGDRYRLEQPLACGGMATIVRARDLWHEGIAGSEPSVAIKLLRPELRDRPPCIARLKREFRQTRSLSHPGIVRHFALDCDRGAWFIVMELLAGEDLGDRLKRAQREPLSVREALRIAAACGDALAFAHDHGVTHGDVTPGNIFLTSGGELRLLDFGVAADPRPAAPGAEPTDLVRAAATRAYASPEVLAGATPEPRDDVYSLACVISAMLAAHRPYARQSGVLVDAMAASRQQRPTGIREMLQALGSESEVAVLRRRRAPVPIDIVVAARRVPTAGRWRAAGGVAGAAALAVLAGAVGYGLGSSPPPPVAAPTAGAQDATEAAAPVPFTAAASVPLATASDAPDGSLAALASTTVPPPTPVARVSFDVGSLVVSSGAIAAAIPIRRAGQVTQRASVEWRLIDGSAVAGRDFAGPRSGVARFPEGVQVHVVYVPIMAGTAMAGDRVFRLELTEASKGLALGAARSIDVTIQGEG
jgi:hypothetical protein